MAKQVSKKGLPKVLIVVIVALILIGGGGYYFFSQKTGIALPGMIAPLNPNCKYNDPNLCKFLNNWKEIKDYTVTSTGTFEGKTSESIMKLNGAGDTHLLSKTDGKEDYNMISIGDTSYTKDYSDEKWWKTVTKAVTTDTKTTDIKNEFNFDSKEVEDKTTYTANGKESCGDKTCFKYEVVNPDVTDSTEFILFDDREYRLRKTISTSKGTSSESTFSYDNVTISAPSPTKDAGDGSGMYNQSGASEAEVNKIMKQYQGENTAPSEEQPVTDDSSGN